MGIELEATHARLCFPAANWSACFLWQPAQVAGVGIFASLASSILLCAEPWHAEQSMPFFPIFPSRCCCTTPGVTFWWQSTQELFFTAADAVALTSRTRPIANTND